LLYWQTVGRLGSVDARKGDFIGAADKLESVFEGERELLGSESPDVMLEYVNYANALIRIGNTNTACPILKKTLEAQTLQKANNLWANEYTRISLGECLLQDEGPQHTDTSIELLSDALSNLSAGGREFSSNLLFALATLARAELASGHRGDAKTTLTRLVDRSEISRLQKLRGLAVRDTAFFTWIDGFSFSGYQLLGYRELALLHAEDGELERALRVSELARDRTLGDQFAEQQWLRDVAPEDARRRLEPLDESIQDLDERLAVAPDLMERVRLESERTGVVAQRGRLERELRAAGLRGEDDFVPPTLDLLREHLDGRTALVSVTHSGGTWWALVIRRDAPARFVPFADPDLGRAAAAWVRRLRGEPVRAWPVADGRLVLDDLRPAGATGGFLSTSALAERLGRALLDPLAAAAGNARHLVFVGDDELAGVPLQALPLGKGLAIDRYDISYAPSLSTYARWQNAPAARHPRDLLAIGAIDYPRHAGPQGDDMAALGLEFAADHPLPRTGAEIAAIGAQFPPGRQRLMAGAAARKTELRAASRSGELAGYRYVHLATHAWADPERPEASAVLLASDGSEAPRQVVMTAAELAGLRMNSDLIVLSACDTGAGHFEHGRGLLGLAYAALAAGNRAAVLSLWPIADDSTAPFMAHFYARLARGNDPVAALAATQREFRGSPDARLADPGSWAAFVLYGGY